MIAAPSTPVSVPFDDLRIGDEIHGFRPDTDTEYVGRVEDRSTHTLWIGRTHSPRLIVHNTDGHRFELVRPAPPAPWSQPSVACPSWCGQDSIDDEGSMIHIRRIGTMGVEISQSPNEQAVIAWPADHEVSDYPTADQAAQIGADLIEAARLLRMGSTVVESEPPNR